MGSKLSKCLCALIAFASLALPTSSARNISKEGVGIHRAESGAPASEPITIGSGNEWIHIIPSLSSPSVENGGKLTFRVLVKAKDKVQAVEAGFIVAGKQECVSLSPVQGLATATMADGNIGVWEAEWVGHDLQHQYYPVTIRATDEAGHQVEDRALRFSDPIAGNSEIGTANYANGGMELLDNLDMLAEQPSCTVIDANSHFLYMGTESTPAKIVKIDLSTFTETGSLGLASGENNLTCAAIDTSAGYAYFGNDAGKIVKIDLATFKRAGAISLPTGEKLLRCAVIDPAAGFAYFGGNYDLSNAAKVIKIDLATFTRVGSITLNSGENAIRCAAIDPAAQLAYFSSMAGLVKINLTTFSRVGSTAASWATSAAIDPNAGYAYFGISSVSPGVVEKVDLATFTRVGALTLSSGETNLFSAAIDPGARYAYFGVGQSNPGKVVKIDLSTFTRVAGLSLTGGVSSTYLTCSAIDIAAGFAYFGAEGGVSVSKVDLSTFTKAADISLSAGASPITTVNIDSDLGYAYLGSPGVTVGSVVRVDLVNFNMVDRIFFNSGETGVRAGFIDQASHIGYFTTTDSPSKIVKVDLASFTRLGAIQLNSGENNIYAGAIDSAAGYAYLATKNIPAKVVKINLNSFTRAGALSLNSGENFAASAVIDPVAGFAYFGLETSPGIVVKVDLATFTRVGALAFNSGENSAEAGVIDPQAGKAYFGLGSSPGRTVRVDLASFTRDGVVSFPGTSNIISNGGAIDAASGIAYFLVPNSILKLELGAFQAAGTLSTGVSNSIEGFALDALTGFGYVGSAGLSSEGIAVKAALSSKGFLYATQMEMPEWGALGSVHFYSHKANGNLRLGIYDDGATTRTLLWDSGPLTNSVADGWLDVPITSGNPATLALNAGNYWLAWETDSMAGVASYAAGSSGDGFRIERVFGTMPDSITPLLTSPTSSVWSEYLTYVAPRTLTYLAGPHGSISGATPQTVDTETSGTPVTAVPDLHYHFVQWSDSSTSNPRTDTNVTTDVTATAIFGIDTYTLAYSADANGSIGGTTPQTVDYGSSGTAVTAIPDPYYHFVQWSDGSTANPRTDTNVTTDATATASFEIDTFSLDYSAGFNGSIIGTTHQTVDYGTSGATVTAMPALHYHFVQWSDGSIANPRTDLNVTTDVLVTASFAIDTYTLAYSAEANGLIGGTTPQTIDYGSSGTAVTALPNPHFHFVQWSDSSTANPRTDTNVTTDVTATATFAIDSFSMDYSAGANGSIAGTTPQIVDYGTSGTAVTAIPDPHFHFVQWSDGSLVNPRMDTNVSTDVLVTADFAIDTYTLAYDAGANGSIGGTTTQTIDYGSSGTAVAALPDPHFHFVQWSDGSTASPRTDANVTTDVTVTASFAIDTYTLSYAAGANGSISGATPQTVDYGASGAPVTAVPDPHYHLVQWSDGSTANPRADANVNTDASVTASFAIDTFSLIYSAGTHGSIGGIGAQTVDYGTSGSTVTAVPNLHYHFVQWSDGSTSNPRTELNVSSDVTVTANFAIDTFTLAYSAGVNGSISGTTPQTVDYGASGAAVTAVAHTGYSFVQWSDGSTANPRTDASVSANLSLIATFAPTPIWIDFSFGGIEDGTLAFPFNTLAEGVAAVVAGGEIKIKPGNSGEAIRITKAVRLTAPSGSARIGI